MSGDINATQFEDDGVPTIDDSKEMVEGDNQPQGSPPRHSL
jgi:hypothetical protein